MTSVGDRVFVARLAGTNVVDPIGDLVGRVRDVVVLLRATREPRVVGLVVEVPGRRRVFLPITRVTSIVPGQVISTGLLFERQVELRDGSGHVVIEDVAITPQRTGDWLVTQLFVRRAQQGKSGILRRRGETMVIGVDEVVNLLGSGAVQGAAMLLANYDDLKPADLADVLHELAEGRRTEVAAALDNERLADVMEELPEDDRVAILSGLDVDRAADVLESMQPDDAADLLGELPDAQAAELLARMEPEDARDVRRLLAYAEDTAGGLMTTEPVILGPETTIAAALAHVRRQDLAPALASTVFVVRPPLETPTGRFLGVVHLQRMLREPPHQAIGTILDDDIDALAPHAPLMQVTRLMATYNLLALPVVDAERRLIGAISVDDVLDHLLPEDWRETEHEGVSSV
jgi:flagellar motility protein MotE (MotC chaperone)/sporulation protein YlmC with PRC-barrel domain